MSTNNIEAEAAADDTMMCRASCGTAEVDDIKLSDLVQYCSDKCQRGHFLLDLKATSQLCLALGLLIFSSLWKKLRGGNNKKMSADLGEVADKICCASCGIAEVDDIKLKKCDDCDLVEYCSDKCQKKSQKET